MYFEPDEFDGLDDPDDDGVDIHADLPWNHCARFDGIPGMVWYSEVRQVLGADLRVGDWLDTLDHCGARGIFGIFAGAAPPDQGPPDEEHLSSLRRSHIESGLLTVLIGGGQTETVRADVSYDVVNPDSQVTPDGTPVVLYDDVDDADVDGAL